MPHKIVLELSNLNVSISEKKILKGLNLSVGKGEVHAIMGPNGSGKSTLAMSVIGHPGFKVDSNSVIKINGVETTGLFPEDKARLGLFVSFQNPVEITGVSFLAFVRTAYKELYPKEKIKLSEFKKDCLKAFRKVGLGEDFLGRSLNEGFSGGERKRAEIAQLLILKPKIVILDEIDSGLDIDSLKIVSNVLYDCVRKGMTVIVITHYQRILSYLKPDKVHVLVSGKIKKSGGMRLVKTLEKDGYAAV